MTTNLHQQGFILVNYISQSIISLFNSAESAELYFFTVFQTNLECLDINGQALQHI